MLAAHALALTGVPMRQVLKRVQQARDKRYSMLRGYFHGADDASNETQLQTVAIDRACFAHGRSLAELQGRRSELNSQIASTQQERYEDSREVDAR